MFHVPAVSAAGENGQWGVGHRKFALSSANSRFSLQFSQLEDVVNDYVAERA